MINPVKMRIGILINRVKEFQQSYSHMDPYNQDAGITHDEFSEILIELIELRDEL